MAHSGIPEKESNSALGYTGILERTMGRGIDWDDLRVFLAVARVGSFNKAAADLKLTQPTVSRRINELESILGARLVVRTASGVELTPEGRGMFDAARNIEDAVRTATTRARVASRYVKGEVKASVPEGLAGFWLPRFLAAFFRAYPGVSLKVFPPTQPGEDRRHTLDFQIQYFNANDPAFICQRLGTMHFIPFASKQYLAKYGTPRTIADLSRHRLVDLAGYLIDQGSWNSWLGAEPVVQNMALFTSSSIMHGQSILHGCGIGLLPTYVVYVDDDFVPLDLGLKFEMPLWLTYRREAIREPQVRAAVDFMRAVFDGRDLQWFANNYVRPQHFRTLDREELVKRVMARMKSEQVPGEVQEEPEQAMDGVERAAAE